MAKNMHNNKVDLSILELESDLIFHPAKATTLKNDSKSPSPPSLTIATRNHHRRRSHRSHFSSRLAVADVSDLRGRQFFIQRESP